MNGGEPFSAVLAESLALLSELDEYLNFDISFQKKKLESMGYHSSCFSHLCIPLIDSSDQTSTSFDNKHNKTCS